MILYHLMIIFILWPSYTVGQVRSCEYPEIENGIIYKPYWQSEESDRSSFPESIGKVMHYHCNENYVPAQGSPSDYWTKFSCTAEGWSPVPECIRECYLYSVENGHFWPIKGHYKEGDEITIECNHGYRLPNDQDKISCTKQGWSADTDCIRIKMCTVKIYFENGFFSESKSHYLVNAEARYQCKEGYATTDGKKEGFITCGQQGWLNQPQCIKICDIPQFENARYKGNKAFLRPNERLEYECMDGYEITSGETTGVKVCGVDEWPTIIECYVRPCEYPEIENGYIHKPFWQTEKYYRSLFPQSIGKIMYYRCNENYVPAQGSPSDYWTTFSCTEEGWSPVPECLPVRCSAPPQFFNADMIGISKRHYFPGDKVIYHCLPNFQAEGSTEVTCIGGLWKGDPQCKDYSCGYPPQIENGEIISNIKARYEAGETVSYKCIRQFKIYGNPDIVCINKTWTELPQCKVRPCDYPEIENGIIFKPFWYSEQYYRSLFPESIGKVMHYHCNENYVPAQGSSSGYWTTFSCTREGWSPVPECLHITCNPPHLANGNIYPQKDKYRGSDEISYHCKKGFYPPLTGNKSKCTPEGWLPLPRCNLRLCDYPEIENGIIFKPFWYSEQYYRSLFPQFIGKVMHYHCNENYVPAQGSSSDYWTTFSCTGEGWSPVPECLQKKPCSKPPAIQYGAIKQVRSSEVDDDNLESNTYAHNTTVNYSCDEGFKMIGREEITCNMGKWSPSPQCIGI
ncbi:complement factor H-related protein 4-like [Trichosurus vulpecula]|uniref:complement factor H-related protein 4-like n=1 Tax=Trichosurus vulpecula TaxID=9337 RepID=UPI00186B2103|nr:complement factor H-related protein 4-like [Trichosurus vulpecula]